MVSVDTLAKQNLPLFVPTSSQSPGKPAGADRRTLCFFTLSSSTVLIYQRRSIRSFLSALRLDTNPEAALSFHTLHHGKHNVVGQCFPLDLWC
eukprot:scaffold7335_cov162-Skeletonema_dohrnii-CCMP3373.AAC.2